MKRMRLAMGNEYKRRTAEMYIWEMLAETYI